MFRGRGSRLRTFHVLKRKADGFLCLGLGLLSCFERLAVLGVGANVHRSLRVQALQNAKQRRHVVARGGALCPL